MDTKKIFGIAALASVAGLASANTILSFAYSDLEASFDSTGDNGGIFTAQAVDATSGDVTQYTNGSPDTASFGPDFVDFGESDALFNMTISNVSGNTADADGTFILTDFDGDQIVGDIDGTWTQLPIAGPTNAIAFQGLLTNLQYVASGDGVFEGWHDGTQDMGDDDNSFVFADFGEFIPIGALVEVGFGPNSFFNEDWDQTYTTEVGAQVTQIPTPAAGLMAGVGGLALAGRRRRG